MFSPISLIKKLAGARPPDADAPNREDERMQDQLASGIAHYLGETEERASALARAACVQRRRRRSGLAEGPGVPLQAAVRTLGSAVARGPCLLALPFSGTALDLLRELSAQQGLHLLLVESPALAAMQEDLGPSLASVPRCPAREVLKHVRQAAAENRALVYVSFPELHTLASGTTANVAFLGRACRFSLLDPLLCMQGLHTILTIGRQDAGGLELTSCDTAALRAADRSRAMGTVLGWLLGHLQASASETPADTYSWHHLYRASKYCYQIERDNRIKQLDAYFDAWMVSCSGLPPHTYQVAKARLAALRHAS
jgi:hypothetical protein